MLFPIVWDEPFGLVMIESMACGTPVLALPGGSVSEVVEDGVSGLVCNSVDQLVQAVRTLDLQPEAVRAYAEERFSVDAMVDRYIRLYQTLVVDTALSVVEPAMETMETGASAAA
jgi:glycosyltransferase involved in cell wall biosynthesis